MRYNDTISSEYGSFFGVSGEAPVPVKTKPTSEDYDNGNFIRIFSKKINDQRIVEISAEQADRINTSLYRTVAISWTISGPKENRMLNGIVEYGVMDMNKFEIERVKKEQSFDLSGVLSNLLEYWRGH